MVAGASGAVWKVLPVGVYELASPVLVSLLPSRPQLWCNFSPVNRHLFTSDRIPTTDQRQAFTRIQLREPVNLLPRFTGAWVAETESSLSPRPP